MSVFVRQEKITVQIGFQSAPIDRTKTHLYFGSGTKLTDTSTIQVSVELV